MKILLSASNKHFNPVTKEVRIRHSVGVLIELFSKVIEEMGDVTYVSDTDIVEGQEFDLIISWPRNFDNLTKHNKYKKSVCFFNIAESSFLKNQMRAEAGRLGCKLSDCFTPLNYYHADMNFLIGGDEVEKQYLAAGVKKEKIVQLHYRHGFIPYKKRPKNKVPVFLHSATTLGLRKGFWHVLHDFENAKLDAKLICIGKVQKERFWIELVEKYKKHPRIEIRGWLPNSTTAYVDAIHESDFVVFPSFGEGAAGSVLEAMEGGCVPIVSRESGIEAHPLGWYERGSIACYERAAHLSDSLYSDMQDSIRLLMLEKYNNNVFKEKVQTTIKELMHV